MEGTNGYTVARCSCHSDIAVEEGRVENARELILNKKKIPEINLYTIGWVENINIKNIPMYFQIYLLEGIFYEDFPVMATENVANNSPVN